MTGSLVACLRDRADREAVAAAIEARKIRGEVHEGGAAEMVALAGEWLAAPEILMIDIRDVEDPQEALERIAAKSPDGECSVILVGDRDSIKLYRELRSLGVFEYLVAPLATEEVVGALVELARSKIAQGSAVDPNKLMVVAGLRGGAGASSAAAVLAYGIATRHDKRTLLVDLDLHAGVHSVLFDQEPSTGFADAVETPERIDPVFLNRTAARPRPNLSVLSVANSSAPRLTDSDLLRRLVLQTSRTMDVTLLDLPFRSGFGFDICLSAGVVVAATIPTLVGLRETVSFFNFLEQRGFVGAGYVLLNRVGEVSKGCVDAKEFRRRVERPSVEIPYDAKTWALATVRDNPVLDGRTRLARAYQRLLDCLPTAPQARKQRRLFGW